MAHDRAALAVDPPNGGDPGREYLVKHIYALHNA
jgi:hypothetical protein